MNLSINLTLQLMDSFKPEAMYCSGKFSLLFLSLVLPLHMELMLVC